MNCYLAYMLKGTNVVADTKIQETFRFADRTTTLPEPKGKFMDPINEPIKVPDSSLVAACDAMSIRIGRQPVQETGELELDEHVMIAPCTYASVTLAHRAGNGVLQSTLVSDRHIALVPARHLHAQQWSPLGQATTICIRPAFLRELMRKNGRVTQNIAAEFAAVDPFMWHMARSIELQLRARGTLEQSFVESIAVVVGQHLLSRYIDMPHRAGLTGGLPPFKVRSATEYVRAHYQRDIGFRDIASHLQMSPFHFARMFKHSTGESPHQFIMRCRIEVAKKLLIDGERGIADIALEVGYKSQSYFTTRFARIVGATPAAFRAAH